MSKDYEDYITSRAEGFRLIDNEMMRKAKEHSEILTALTKGNMTVKEIHKLYRLPDGKYTKTLKTVYRHLDALEQLDLIKVAGHRKYDGARGVEKLFCRTAKVFTDDQSKEKEWLITEDGKNFLNSLTEVIWLIKDGKGDKAELRKLVEQIFSETQDHTKNMIRQMATDPRYSDLIEGTSFEHIKALLEIAPHILSTMENKDLMEKIRKELS
jgi:Fe2+ or Zn2+ uptake regulation protein